MTDTPGREPGRDPDERPDAGEFIIGLMAAAEECPRPAPLPLVGASERAAVMASPSGSVSFPRTPGAGTLSGTFSSVL